MRGSTGIHLSKEYDYLSIAVNGSLAKDFNHKNTTVSAGVSLAFDTIDPETGRPIAFSKMVLDQGLTQSLVNEDRPTESTRHISTGKQSMHWIAGLLIFPIDMLPIIGTLTPTPLCQKPNAHDRMDSVQARYVLVMCAMEEEARYLRDRMNDCSEVPLTGAMRRTRGTIGGVVVDLVISGIGGVYATMATTAAILDRKPIAVFSCGCSGAHVRELRMGDVVLASEVKPLDAVVLERSGKVRPS